MKIGLIGLGKMGQIRKNSISSTDNEIVKCYDPNFPEISNKVDNVESIFKDPNIEAIFICTPNYLNKEYTIEALKNGKHVFCEKPPAFTAKEVLAVIDIEKNTNLKLMYGFNHRHHDSIKKIKELVNNDTYGKILWMRGRYGKSVDASFSENWRSKKELSGGGILIDQGIHMLDLFLYLANDFDEIQAMVSNRFWKLTDIEDNVFAMLKNNDSGIVASLHSTMTQWRHLFSLEIFLENGYITLNGLKTSSGTYGNEVLTIAERKNDSLEASWNNEQHTTYEINNSWNSEVDYFFKAIENDSTIGIGNSNDAFKLMKIIDKIYEA